MNIAFLIIIILETAGIGVLVWLLIRNRKYLGQYAKRAELLKERRIDFDDIEVNDISEQNQKTLAEAMNSTKNNMQTFLENTKENVVVLSDAINILTLNAEKNREGSEKISGNLYEVTGKVNEQMNLVKANLDIIEDNAAKIEGIDESAKGIGEIVNGTVDDCKAGLNTILQCENKMASVSDKLGQSEEILQEFSKRIQEINEIGEFITDISDSLELLSLNASIEAARAGEAGKGFVVVAGEVSKMADKTSEGISNINNILNSIIASSEQVKNCIRESIRVFDESSKDFEQVSTSFKSIDRQSADINSKMKDIYVKISDITKNSDKSRSQADQVFKASEQVAEGTGDIAKISENTKLASEKMTRNIDALNSMLRNIKKLLSQYRTSVVPVTQKPKKQIKIGVHCILDNAFWHSVRRGIIYAKNELEALGAEVRYLPYLNYETVANLPAEYEKMEKEDFDGFICPGFMAESPHRLDALHKRGKKVYFINCDYSNQSIRDAIFEPDSFDSGVIAAKEMKKALNGRGQVAILTGNKSILNNKYRSEGFEKKISETRGIEIVEKIELGNSEEDAYKKAKDVIGRYPELKGIYVTTGTLIGAAKAVEESRKPIQMVVFDHSQEIFRYIRKGIIAAAIGQDPFGQGHDPIIYMYNSIVTGQPLPSTNMKCRLNVVDRSNVDSLLDM
ncbi:MAG: substrate-binding domain-containing protein [Lachnospiraceae bacterium]|nr:substrate-binding domain-containing protein [Lachnospiraceae bacterium]